MKTEYEKVLLPKSVQQELEKLRHETERLRTQAIADAAEIARLQSGFDELLEIVDYWETQTDYGSMVASSVVVSNINRITGVEK